MNILELNILENALEYIKLNQNLILHVISYTGTNMMDFVLNYNSTHRNYDYVLNYNGNTEIHSGRRGPSRGLSAREFLGESQNDRFMLIELFNPQGRNQVLYSSRRRSLPAPRPPRRN
jgi:hypothetical protein